MRSLSFVLALGLAMALAAPAPAREPQQAEQPTARLDSRGHIVGRTRPDGHGGWRSVDARGRETGEFRLRPDGSVRVYDERGRYLGGVGPTDPRR